MTTRLKPKACRDCGKKLNRKGFLCKNCFVKHTYKSSLKSSIEQKKAWDIIRKMKNDLKQKLHDEILKEILEEEKKER